MHGLVAMKPRFLLFWIAALTWAFHLQAADELPETPVHTAGMQRQGGYFDIFWDEAEGKVFLNIDRFGDDFLFLTALESGLGSNPVGLDRGQLGDSIVCRWRCLGRRVYLEQQNLKFRAEGASRAERRAVADSFAPAILWAGDVVAEAGASRLVDVTSLVVSDRHGIGQSLTGAGQGDYSLDRDRSLPLAESFVAFPDNVELPAMLTFASGTAGSQVRAVAASGREFSIRQRLSFIRLPEPNFQTRPFDPRIGAIDVAYADYAVPLDQSIFKSLMVRHRLELDQAGNVVKPIVYYVDSAAPEPVRTALVEGASWWSQAFDEAGFPGGFKVEVAPEGMDPLDIRFNFIQWVHRQTRGWSYGSSVIDPRTGEIIKGHVSLGSLRVRQDRLLTENLLTDAKVAPGAACGMVFPVSQLAVEQSAGREQAIDVSLARIRQLSAHEVGHTLGISHNFAASTYGDRASVMDYPAPMFRLDANGEIDTSNAYAVGMGIWDLRTIDYMYRPFNNIEDWRAYVDEKLAEDVRDGILYISDADARPLGGAHPAAHLWDNGSDPIAELETTLDIRRVALEKFGAQVLLDGEPLGELVRAFTPLYFYHRYQTEAVVKLVGGVDYAYSMPGDANATANPVNADVQSKAIDALLQTLDAKTLVIEPRLLEILIPPSSRTAWANEEPGGFTGPIFDPLATAETAARMTIEGLLHPARAARLISQGTAGEDHPGLRLILKPLGELVVQNLSLSEAEPENQADRAVARGVASTIVDAMIEVVADNRTREDVRAQVRHHLSEVADELQKAGLKDSETENRALIAERGWVVDKIKRFLERPDVTVKKTEELAPPPGSPIGSAR